MASEKGGRGNKTRPCVCPANPNDFMLCNRWRNKDPKCFPQPVGEKQW